jgi:F420-dependent oxidoreductase-like protein
MPSHRSRTTPSVERFGQFDGGDDRTGCVIVGTRCDPRCTAAALDQRGVPRDHHHWHTDAIRREIMRIGLQIPSFKYPGGTASIRPKLKEIVTTAEAASFYSLWVMDHYYQIQGLFGEAYTDPMLESYATLGYVAGLTEKAHLGVLVTGVIYRYPSVLLKMVNTVDILAGGRTYFGIGAGWYEAEAKGFGIPYPSTAVRFEQLEDTLKLAKALWESDETSFAGKQFSAPAITNNPRPLSTPHPRIMIGGTGPNKTLRMVAQYADACNIGDWVGDENMAHALDVLKGHCETLGRDYDTIEKTALCTIHLAGDDTVSSVLHRIKELSNLGFTHAIFNMPDVSTITPLETFAREIIPAVAEL